jgi:hypothetical protein
MKSLIFSDRWVQAAMDGNDFWEGDGQVTDEAPDACSQFNCFIGFNINKEDTPYLMKIMEKVFKDGGKAAAGAKEAYNRERPLVELKDQDPQLCRVFDREHVLKSSSFPSGHSISAILWGDVLASVDPEDATAILKRAREISESRIICNAHWLSDIQAGRELGSYVFADLQQSTEFQNDIAKAKEEVKNAKAKNEEVKQNWSSTLVATEKYVEKNPTDEFAKKALESMQKIKDWSCDKTKEVLDSFDITKYIGREKE